VDFDGAITMDEHRHIWSAIRGCDPDEAERAMTEHIKNSYERSARALGGPVPQIESLAMARETLMSG